MKKRLLILFGLLLLMSAALAQTADRIRSSAEYLWAEGTDVRPVRADEQALQHLAGKLALTEVLSPDTANREAVWMTYLTDLRSVTQSVATASGGVLRYIAWRDLDRVFQPRWRKVRELVESAGQAVRSGNRDAARTYLSWAEVYLASLPPGEPALRNQLKEMQQELGPGRTDAVRLRNIETEVAAIRRALGTRKMVVNPGTQKKQETLPPTPEAPLPRRMEGLPALGGIRPEFRVKVSPEGRLLPRPVSPTALAATTNPSAWRGSVLAVAELGRVPAFGGMLAVRKGRAGGYISARSNFSFSEAVYDCRSDGATDFGYLWASGQVRSTRLALSVGPVWAFGERLAAYAGVGFGKQDILWEDASGQWARVTDLSAKGVLLESGLLWNIKHFCFSVGLSETSFSAWTFLLGVGWTF